MGVVGIRIVLPALQLATHPTLHSHYQIVFNNNEWCGNKESNTLFPRYENPVCDKTSDCVKSDNSSDYVQSDPEKYLEPDDSGYATFILVNI